MNILEQIFQLLISLIETVFGFLYEFVAELISGIPKKNKEYSADFASAGTLLSSWNHGFCLTGRKNMTVKDSYQNALVIGGTGVGKSSIVLVSSLFSMLSSFIIHDPSGELFLKTAGYLFKKKWKVLVLNFANSLLSCGYNPLERANSSSEIQKVASMLIDNAFGGKSKDPFWNTLASGVVAMLITILKTQEPQYQNLYNVRHLLNMMGSNHKAVDSLFSKYADEILFAEYKAFIAYDDKVINGVLATAKAALQIFSDESVAKVTSFDSINMQDFRTQPVALFIQNSVADQKYYSVLTSLFFEQCFSYVLGRFPKEKENDIFLLIDEASSLNIPTLPLAVANVRKHRAGVMLLVQDFAQLVHNYGRYDADAIKANCFAKMYFTGQSFETTTELEHTLGKYEYEDKNGKKVVRPLMTNNEIRTMKSNRALLVCGNHPPIMARLRPYYKKALYRKYSSYHAPKTKSDVDASPVPLLNLTVPKTKSDEPKSS